MKIFKRWMCVSLALLMLVPLLIACKKNEETPGRESGSAPTSDVAGSSEGSSTERVVETDENGYQIDTLGTRNYGGKEIRILAWQEAHYKEYDLEFDQIEGTVLGQQVYNRNMKVEHRMGVKLVYTETTGYNATYRDYVKKAETMITDQSVDAFGCYSMAATPLMVQGYLNDLTALEPFDFEAPWWSQDLVARASLYDRLYFATGSISPSFLGNAWHIIYNKKMADEVLGASLEGFGVSSLYEMVDDNTWTIDNFITLAKNVTIMGATKTADETYGFVTDGTGYDPFYFGAGLVTLDNAADGSLQISDDWSSARAIELSDKLLKFFNGTSAAAQIDRNGIKVNYGDPFKDGRALFATSILASIPNLKENTTAGEQGIGILPMPKWDESQEEYLSTAGFTFTLYSVNRASDRKEATAAALECLASEGYRQTEPALYETVLKIQSTDSDGGADDRRMIDLVRNSVRIDAGRLHNNNISSLGWGMFRNSIMDDLIAGNPNSTYESFFEKNGDNLEEKLEIINTSVFNIEEIYG